MNINQNNSLSNMRVTYDNTGTVVTDQSLVVAGTAVEMIATALNDATEYVLWTLSGGDALFTLDGSDPAGTEANGHLVQVGTDGVWDRKTAQDARWIRDSAVSARLHITELQGK